MSKFCVIILSINIINLKVGADMQQRRVFDVPSIRSVLAASTYKMFQRKRADLSLLRNNATELLEQLHVCAHFNMAAK